MLILSPEPRLKRFGKGFDNLFSEPLDTKHNEIVTFQ